MPQQGYSRNATIAGWLVALLYVAHQQMTVFLARSDRFGALREDYRGWHYLLGTLVLGAVVWRLLLWRREAAPAGTLPPALQH